jgi:cation diffusion facilitator CzcD-associated flavoprotein CzcO
MSTISSIPATTSDVLVIGAGPGGIATAIILGQHGIDDVRLLERAPEFGGTWYNNRYPGLACDICCDHYSFSFYDSYDWSRAYPRPAEFRTYLAEVVERFEIGDRITTGVAVERAEWLADDCVWQVHDSRGDVHRARVLVGAVGMFNELVRPDIAGLDRFRGPVVHTGEWPLDGGADLVDGKRVAVIGSAASAVQMIPTIAPYVAHLDVYQRTANWVFPKDDGVWDADTRAARRADASIGGGVRAESARRVDLLGTFDNADMIAAMHQAGLENLARVRDPELRRRLTPQVPIGAQRPLISSDYYEAFNRDEVALVTDAIVEVTEDGVRTADGSVHAADTIVIATGYAAHKFLSVLDVRGRDGIALADLWRDGAYAYLGVAVERFPNLFMLYGPNTNNGSIIDKLESQARYIAAKVVHMREHGIDALEVRPDVVAAYNEGLQDLLAHVEVWQVEGSRYYRAPSGRIVTQCPYDQVTYDAMTRSDDLDAYDALVRIG